MLGEENEHRLSLSCSNANKLTLCLIYFFIREGAQSTCVSMVAPVEEGISKAVQGVLESLVFSVGVLP